MSNLFLPLFFPNTQLLKNNYVKTFKCNINVLKFPFESLNHGKNHQIPRLHNARIPRHLYSSILMENN